MHETGRLMKFYEAACIPFVYIEAITLLVDTRMRFPGTALNMYAWVVRSGVSNYYAWWCLWGWWMDSLTCWFDLKGYRTRRMDGFVNDATTSCVKSVVTHCFQATSDSVDSTYISIHISKIFSLSVTTNRRYGSVSYQISAPFIHITTSVIHLLVILFLDAVCSELRPTIPPYIVWTTN